MPPTIVVDKTAPAFPCVLENGFQYYGLSTRELFAALAMQALAQRGGYDVEELCADAVKAADALVEALADG